MINGIGGVEGKSQGQLSKDAKASSEAAATATKGARDNDSTSHRQAANAHHEAANMNTAAGNASKSGEHRKQAMVHEEKAEEASRTQSFANDFSRRADELTTKAELACHGDTKDPRSEKELHASAADAHGKAADAQALAKNEPAQKRHLQKQAEHALAAK